MPQDIAHNRFMNGIATDPNDLDRKNDSAIDLVNWRITNRGGQSRAEPVRELEHAGGNNWKLTALKGMIETFTLKDGYVPIGYDVYNGVAYIISLNVEEDRVEFGTYPSPTYTEGNCIGWQKNYKPLNNYTGDFDYNSILYYSDEECANCEDLPLLDADLTGEFNIPNSLVGFDCKHAVSVLTKQSYDGTINFYTADGNTPNIVINSGFHNDTAQCIPRYFNENDFIQGTVKHFNESCFLPTVSLNRLTATGQHTAGIHVFFIRYANSNQSPTSFIAQSGPVQIFLSPAVGALAPLNTYGGEEDSISNKGVVLDIQNLDLTYPFIEIGVVHFSGDQTRAWIIDKLFNTNGLVNIEVEITGFEARREVSIDEIINLKPYTDIAYDHTDLNNVYYGANWKGQRLHHPDLCTYAKCAKIHERRILAKSSNFPDDGVVGVNSVYNYEQDTHGFVGYFSGETYMFLLHPLFTNGQMGLGYPMTGYDFFDGVETCENCKGIFRFSCNALLDAGGVGYDGRVYNPASNAIFVKHPMFDFTDCEVTDWIDENVCGWFISRAERKPNLLYQGLALQCFIGELATHGHGWPENFDANGGNDEENFQEDKWVPLFANARGGLTYSFYSRDQATHDSFFYGNPNIANTIDGGAHAGPPPYAEHTAKDDHFGIFSMDYFLDVRQGRNASEGTAIKTLGRADFSAINSQSTEPITVTGEFPAQSVALYTQFTIANDVEYINAEFIDVPGWSLTSNAGFASKFEGGRNPIDDSFYAYKDGGGFLEEEDRILNMPFAVPDYIGVKDIEKDIHQYIVNVYKTDPTSYEVCGIQGLYDPATEPVCIISNFIRKEDLELAPEVPIFRGDCFVQRCFLKIYHATTEYGGFMEELFASTEAELQKGYGHLVDFVTENKYNHFARYEVGGNLFYPATGHGDLGLMSFLYDQPESNFYNNGYIRFLGPRKLAGFDQYQFYGVEEYITRIMYSIVQTIQGTEDAYRNIPDAQQNDFDLRYGPMVRIIADHNRLVTVQHRAINSHPVQERAYAPGTEGSPILLGNVNELTDFVNRLSDRRGSQHKMSVQKGDLGIYGVDANKRTIWRAQGNQVEFISETKEIDTLLHKVLEQITKCSDRSSYFKDEHICGTGIHAEFDLSFNQMLFTFKFEDEELQDYTLFFDEKIDRFARYSFTPKFYLRVEEDFFSFVDHRAFMHDCDEENYNTFYGELHKGIIVWSVNKDSHNVYDWMNLVISSNNVKFHRTVWETQHQNTEILWDTAPFWYEPKYLENVWDQPIPRAEGIQNTQLQIYDPKSSMRGRYILVKLEYFDNKYAWVKETFTKMVISKG